MTTTPDRQLQQIKLLAELDVVVGRAKNWSNKTTDWLPMNTSQAVMQRVLDRVESLRVRWEAPLVVATFGGTGSGKSSLVNALIGEEVATPGRERPTTKQPLLIAHSSSDLEPLRLPAQNFRECRIDADILRDLVIIDCPDPDTTEVAQAGSNLQQLRELVPFCDVLLYVSTQQKYRSARVLDELQDAAGGCRIVFVQTHADVDDDIRDDWRNNLQSRYEVPEIFFVDSVRALEEQQNGQQATGDLGRLQTFLTNRFSANQRSRIRRENSIDLLKLAIDSCEVDLEESIPAVTELSEVLQQQQAKLSERMTKQLSSDLLETRHLWERRLLSEAIEHWGTTPFSLMLQLYSGLGGLLASFGMMRARTTAQVAIIGAMQGWRWVEQQRDSKRAESTVKQAAALGLDHTLLSEVKLVIAGYIHSAKFNSNVSEINTMEAMKIHAEEVEEEFMENAQQQVDDMISELARKNAGRMKRLAFELLFLTYVIFILLRIGVNFFYQSLIYSEPILEANFYIPAGVFFLLWTGILITLFTRGLRDGLEARVSGLAQSLVQRRLSHGLFPELEQACHAAKTDVDELKAVGEQVSQLQLHIQRDESNDLGHIRVQSEHAST